MLLFLHTACALAFSVPVAQTPTLKPDALHIGDLIGEGTFGSVHWARVDGSLCVAKTATHGGESLGERADEYLGVEEHVSRLLCESIESQHLAPYLGSCLHGGERTLVWRACGEHTLDHYLADASGRERLARALGCAIDELAPTVLRELLSALSAIHACGVCHRDVKPENLLIDASRQTVVLIDFGSAAEVGGWIVKKGLKADRVPCSVLYMPPEQALDLSSPAAIWGYDVYSAAMVWLSVALPSVGASEDELFALRLDLKAHRHDPHAWLAAATAMAVPEAAAGDASDAGSSRLPAGWHAAFGADERGALAWELLASMIAHDPAQRPCAAEALVGPFIQASCTGEAPLAPAPQPWTLEALAQSGSPVAEHRRLMSDDCPLPEEE